MVAPWWHEVFVALGVAAAAAAFWLEARRRGRDRDDRVWVVVAGALVGGAVMMRLGTWLQHVDLRANATLTEQWLYGNRSILGGLVGAYVGVHLAKRLVGYRQRTGDLFAPAVALGMAVGRIGCLLTELPGTPTGGWGVTLSPEEAARLDGPAGVTLHLSFGYEIAFHLVAFAVLWGWLRHQPIASGETLTLYLAAYGIFRFLVEFVRGNEVVFASLTRPQLFLLLTVPLILIRVAYQFRHGAYDVRREEGSPVSDSDLPPPRPLSPPSDERGPARARRRLTQARHPSGHRSRPRGTYALTRGCAVRSADHKEWL